MDRYIAAIRSAAICIVFILSSAAIDSASASAGGGGGGGAVVELNGEPEDVAWIVQLSDLHFSAHHHEGARDFMEIVGPTLAMVNPSLVFITGDLTDAKSKDLLSTRQYEVEWAEYQKVMEEVIRRSGLKKSNFFDLRGNHDTYGGSAGGPFDFYSKYSINGQLRRSGLVNSVTVQTGTHNILFVGFDSTMSSGLRGPTNLFGHPTDQLLTEINSELSQWDSHHHTKPILKISFGHFPLSFSASAYSGRTLKDVFLNQSLSVYLCGHLHATFGKNLKWLHEQHKQYDMRTEKIQEFWEWEMGDWKKSRAMRVLAIDRGFISFIDVDLRLGVKGTIILPTFPLDSRFSLSFQNKSESVDPTFYSNIRALVFSSLPISSVMARVYDSKPGSLSLAFESPMEKIGNASSRGNLYSCPWNFKTFEDSSPERFLLQIEAVDVSGRSSLSEPRPFSVGGQRAMLSHTWKEIILMDYQFDALYYPLLWSCYAFILSILLIPKTILSFSRKTDKNFNSSRGLASYLTLITMELHNVPWLWRCIIGYLFYLILCPWLFGQGLVEGERGYMSYRGWALKFGSKEEPQIVGFPDIMVVVIPHLYVVVLPTVIVIGALVVEAGLYRDNLRVLSGKKDDDYDTKRKGSNSFSHGRHHRLTSILFSLLWIRKVLLLFCLTICCSHFFGCVFLSKAYEMNPVVHFPIYCMSVPLLLAYAIYRTSKT